MLNVYMVLWTERALRCVVKQEEASRQHRFICLSLPDSGCGLSSCREFLPV